MTLVIGPLGIFRCSAGEDVLPKTDENKLDALLSDLMLGSGEVSSYASGGVAGGTIEVRAGLREA